MRVLSSMVGAPGEYSPVVSWLYTLKTEEGLSCAGCCSAQTFL
ncbi:FIG00554809: hypothetical protein [Cronobacter malonaticus 507]|nr:FIG00554809: hypothetical protein [Cronobacter malonaticus 681]CCJ97076.1 FIG00554809: hypothetical protein [Cronobacter malonaticus 507]